jgi:4-amino-4-deoxy-L-arabinose transferase-like glycosyltransferase
VRSSLYRRRYGFGHLFGLLFLIRHPLFILVVAVVAFAVYLYRRRR